MVHPDQSEQVPAMIERYKELVGKDGGILHRLEDWGRRPLAYQIGKLGKAHYVLMNIEAGRDTLNELERIFRYNDAVLRHLVLRRDEAETGESVLMRKKRLDDDREATRAQRWAQQQALRAAQSDEAEAADTGDTPAKNDDAATGNDEEQAAPAEAPSDDQPENADEVAEAGDTPAKNDDAATGNDEEQAAPAEAPSDDQPENADEVTEEAQS